MSRMPQCAVISSVSLVSCDSFLLHVSFPLQIVFHFVLSTFVLRRSDSHRPASPPQRRLNTCRKLGVYQYTHIFPTIPYSSLPRFLQVFTCFFCSALLMFCLLKGIFCKFYYCFHIRKSINLEQFPQGCVRL